MSGLAYLKDPNAIYARSFETILHETDLSGLPASVRDVAVRMIHACGMPDIISDLRFTPDVAEAGRDALAAGAPVIADCEAVSAAVTRRSLPARNEVVCTLNDPRTAALSGDLGTTRSAAAVSLWQPNLSGAVVVIGNAPTALFALLEALDGGAPRPAALIATPVGFVGAEESKEELTRNARGVPFMTLAGRRGGSAIAAAALNALAIAASA
ncbi:MAG: precorrin-8X methylmutase [Hyphomicrobiaceae bacterium]|nr:precorrin-8X methylmutase [Hyphomicrobiaceae bacterium]